jgi:hypothetical protein
VCLQTVWVVTAGVGVGCDTQVKAKDAMQPAAVHRIGTPQSISNEGCGILLPRVATSGPTSQNES